MFIFWIFSKTVHSRVSQVSLLQKENKIVTNLIKLYSVWLKFWHLICVIQLCRTALYFSILKTCRTRTYRIPIFRLSDIKLSEKFILIPTVQRNEIGTVRNSAMKGDSEKKIQRRRSWLFSEYYFFPCLLFTSATSRRLLEPYHFFFFSQPLIKFTLLQFAIYLFFSLQIFCCCRFYIEGKDIAAVELNSLNLVKSKTFQE